MLFAIVFSFFILFGATRNFTTSFISMVCIFVIMNTVTAVTSFFEWELGMTESLSCICSIGLSINYVVLFAANLSESPSMTRKERMSESYQSAGISITFSFLASIGAILPLLLSYMPMSYKFGVIVSTSIGASFLTSMLLFGALSQILGTSSNSCICCNKSSNNKIQM